MRLKGTPWTTTQVKELRERMAYMSVSACATYYGVSRARIYELMVEHDITPPRKRKWEASDVVINDVPLNTKELYNMASNLLKNWGLSGEERSYTLYYLDISKARDLLAIHRALKASMGGDCRAAYEWMKTPSSDFEGESPTEFILNRDFACIAELRCYIESRNKKPPLNSD